MSDSKYISAHASASSQKRWLAIASLVVSFAGLIYLRLFDPVTGAAFFPQCPFHALTGLHCPGCGTTRALHQLLQGHLAAAFAFNPFTVLALPFLAYATLSYALFGIRGRGLPKVFVPAVLIRLLFWAVLSFWILRNVPVYPFTLLAPHNI